MARTNIPVTTAVMDTAVDPGAGTSVDPTNGHVISVEDEGHFFLFVNLTFAGAKTVTVKAPVVPVNEAGRPLAGLGDLVVSINNGFRVIGPLSSARFSQASGADVDKVYVDVESAATGTIRAVQMPK